MLQAILLKHVLASTQCFIFFLPIIVAKMKKDRNQQLIDMHMSRIRTD